MAPLNAPQTQPYLRRRRYFSREFKANIAAICLEPGVSASHLALDNQLNANLLRHQIREAQQASRATTSPAFMRLASPAASASAEPGRDRSADQHDHTCIEVPRAGGALIVEWPAEQTHKCLVLLRELDDPRRDLVGGRALGHARRAGQALARVIQVFGAAKPHHAYLFANRRGNRMKVPIHDGFDISLCAGRLHRGKFHRG